VLTLEVGVVVVEVAEVAAVARVIVSVGGHSRSYNRGSHTTRPVEVGKEYEVDVTETSRQGDGIARVQGHHPACCVKKPIIIIVITAVIGGSGGSTVGISSQVFSQLSVMYI
jgi:hypothetical protein